MERSAVFVIPFMAGFVFALTVLAVRYLWWLRGLRKQAPGKLPAVLFSHKTLSAINEIFNEAILHRRILKRNRRMGFMHMSLAVGWGMMILGGKFETWFHTGRFFHDTWYAVFFRYFEPQVVGGLAGAFWLHYMDLGLLVVLSGVTLAVIKRIKKKVLGIKNTTRHSRVNRLALTFLWLVFPLRLLAEAVTFGQYGGGGFLTGTLGKLCFTSPMFAVVELPLWWAYSLVLGAFFVVLPFSRYLHIPTEMVLILLRHWGLRASTELKPEEGLQAFEVHACSACGMCLDVCPAIGQQPFQAAYFMQAIRSGKGWEKMATDCLSCGACENACPVNIGIENMRVAARGKVHQDYMAKHDYLPILSARERRSANILLFTGCMGRLKPGITEAVKQLLEEAGLSWVHLDEKDSICCGRPMALAGRTDQAATMRAANEALIGSYRAGMLVTTCPICLNQFRNEYKLNIPVVHHSVLLWQLMSEGRIKTERGLECFSYHDPCELGRKGGHYNEPRELLSACGNLLPVDREKSESLCCGNTPGSLSLSLKDRQNITAATLKVLEAPHPDKIVTACPLCQHNLSRQSKVPVKDIAEVLAGVLISTSTQAHYSHEAETIEA